MSPHGRGLPGFSFLAVPMTCGSFWAVPLGMWNPSHRGLPLMTKFKRLFLPHFLPHPTLFSFFFSFLFRASSVVYGSSQVRGWIGAAAATYTTATVTCITAHGNTRSFNPLSEARDQTHVLIDPSRIHYHWAKMGTPVYCFAGCRWDSLCPDHSVLPS